MARKKTVRKKKQRSKKGIALKTHLKRISAWLFLLILIIVASGFFAHQFILHKRAKTPSAARFHIQKQPLVKIPTYEIYPKNEILPSKPKDRPKDIISDNLPKVAIIIDDLGYDKNIAEKFMGLDAVLTYSFLPFSPFQKNIENRVREKGFDTMLHLPMEPIEYPKVDPGPGALITTMSPDQLIDQLNKDLDAVPFIKGVNNHMGSRMTTQSAQMHQIMSVLKKRGLFFIDSRTALKTACKPSARLLQVPFAQRDVFIDHIQQPDFIRKQIKQMVIVAQRHGEAIGIAHPHILTYKILREELPGLKEKVRLVPASELVHIIDASAKWCSP